MFSLKKNTGPKLSKACAAAFYATAKKAEQLSTELYDHSAVRPFLYLYQIFQINEYLIIIVNKSPTYSVRKRSLLLKNQGLMVPI